MARLLDLDGHPWAHAGRQAFRLKVEIDDLCADDVLRLTDRATGGISYWKVEPPDGARAPAKVDGVWRGVLTQTDWGGS